MLDRASTFANPEIVQFLKTRTVPVAIDQAYQRRQKDTEGEFYRKIVSQSPRKNFGNKTTQGLYMAAADGTYLGFTNHRAPERVMKMLTEALAEQGDGAAKQIQSGSTDKRWNPKPPEGGLIVRVQAKILDGYEEPESEHRRIFQNAMSRDNLWITAEEHKAIVAGEVPPRLVERIARFHLVDSTRGEPSMWRKNEVASADFSIDGKTLSGHAELKTSSGDRSYSVDLLGEIEVEDGVVTSFNAVALGRFSGSGRYTSGAPKKPFPLAISFTLADGTDIADGIPPQASRGWIDGYFRPQ